jgi:hypothetical protein
LTVDSSSEAEDVQEACQQPQFDHGPLNPRTGQPSVIGTHYVTRRSDGPVRATGSPSGRRDCSTP